MARRRGRGSAVVAAIVVAAVSFCLLTSAVATSQLRVQGTVNANFRSAYDILVRPASSQTPLEASDRLVQENYLSGIYGGITLAQYHQVQELSGVQVAAPIAMVGYMMPFENISIPASPYLSGGDDELLRLKITENGDNGLSHYPSPTQYVYVAHGPSARPVSGSRSACSQFYESLPFKDSAFDLAAQTSMRCYSVDRGSPGTGAIRLETPYNFPVLVAAIDPAEEAKLVGLDAAMVSGRYLTATDRTRIVASNLQGKQVPPTTSPDRSRLIGRHCV